MVDALGLGPSAARHGGSTPLSGTNSSTRTIFCLPRSETKFLLFGVKAEKKNFLIIKSIEFKL